MLAPKQKRTDKKYDLAAFEDQQGQAKSLLAYENMDETGKSIKHVQMSGY